MRTGRLENDLLSRYKSGSKSNHSTANLNINDFILKAMGCKQVMVLVLLDISEAFDSLNHDKILAKLEKMGT